MNIKFLKRTKIVFKLMFNEIKLKIKPTVF